MQAWPPSSTKTNAVLVTKEDVENEVVAAYENEATQNRPHCDTDAIADRVRGQTAFDLVLRQTVRNGQGANVMVLSQRKTVVSLDLYQAKHYNKIPTHTSRETIGALASLGVDYDAAAECRDPFNSEPETGAAGYSYLGIHRFLDYLSCALHTTVNVRNRVVVFSGGWDSFVKGTTWKEFDLEAAKHKNVWLWTKEMMEPTISALVSVFRSPKQRNES